MALSFTVRECPEFLHCETSGPASYADMRAGVDLTRALARNRGLKRVLVDMRGVDHALRFTEHLQLGLYIAESFAMLERVASVVAPGHAVGVSAKTAQKLGTQVRTFEDFDEAVAWLRS